MFTLSEVNGLPTTRCISSPSHVAHGQLPPHVGLELFILCIAVRLPPEPRAPTDDTLRSPRQPTHWWASQVFSTNLIERVYVLRKVMLVTGSTFIPRYYRTGKGKHTAQRCGGTSSSLWAHFESSGMCTRGHSLKLFWNPPEMIKLKWRWNRYRQRWNSVFRWGYEWMPPFFTENLKTI